MRQRGSDGRSYEILNTKGLPAGEAKIDTDPSELPQASINPYSTGAQHNEFTEIENSDDFQCKESKEEALTRSVVIAIFVQLSPFPMRFFPNDNFPIIRARRQQTTVHRMRPTDLPYWSFVSEERKKVPDLRFDSKLENLRTQSNRLTAFAVHSVSPRKFSPHDRWNTWPVSYRNSPFEHRAEVQASKHLQSKTATKKSLTIISRWFVSTRAIRET